MAGGTFDLLMPIEAIFFDIGDTLVTDRPVLDERVWAACRRCGIDSLPEGGGVNSAQVTSALRRVEDYALTNYAKGATTDDPAVMLRTAGKLLEELGVEPAYDLPADLVAAFAAQPFERVLEPSALSLIDTLKARGVKIGVISDWDIGLPDLLAGWKLAERIDALAVSEIVGCTKPDPRLFRYALSQTDVDPARALHIGDFYELDVAGARAAGMQALLIDRRGRTPEADCPRFRTFDELVSYLLSPPSFGG